MGMKMIEKTLEINDSFYTFLYLLMCGVEGKPPSSELLREMNMEDVYQISVYHTLSAMTYMILEKGQDILEGEVFKNWKKEKDKAIRKNILLDRERERIFAFMEEQGIWHMPLKGIILKEMYPAFGMRQMADNDILYDSNFQNSLCIWMKEQGYKVISCGRGNHDVYEKKPVYNYEMHTALYGGEHNPVWITYYENIKEKLIADKKKKYSFHFTDEDFYIYIITHIYKHFAGSGTGIRSLLDVYIYLQAKEAIMNWDYINEELKKVQVSDFEGKVRHLSQKVFSKELQKLTKKEEELLKYFLYSGTYGTLENHVQHRLDQFETDKKGYIIKRLVPDEEFYKNYVPFVYQHKWSRPFFIIFRLVRGLFRKDRRIMKEIKALKKAESR
jgi:hypothetical protein